MASTESENVAPVEGENKSPKNPEVTKWSIRQHIWDYLEDNDLVEFPRPCHNRIPNFKGAAEAADKAKTLEVFQKARTIKVNPDKPQQHVRFLTLEADKTLLVPTPRLRQGLFNKIIPPPDCGKDVLRTCSTSQGVREHSKPVGLEDKVTIDLVIIGSVAVSEKGLRIGKGEGFADLEFAMMTAMEAVNENTIVVTTVHDTQVTDIPEHLIEEHDLTVDFIVTPTRIIECPYRPKPPGIFWNKLDRAKLAQVPILRKLRNIERAVGKDVRVKEDLMPREPRPDQNGEDGDGDRPDKGRPRRPRRFNRNRNRNSQSGEGNQQNGIVSGEDGEHGDGASSPESGKPRPRRRLRNRRRPRNSEASVGDESGDVKHEDGAPQGDSPDGADKPRPRRRRPNNRRKRDSERSAGGDAETSGRESEGEGKTPKPRRRRPRRNSRSNKENEQSEGDEGAGGDAIRQNRRRLNKLPSLYVGGIPRSVRVSEFKADVRGKEVNPISVRWQGGMGRAFLVFDNTEEAERALEALKGLSLNGKELKIEVSNRNSKLFNKEAPDVPNENSMEHVEHVEHEEHVEQDTQVKQEVEGVNTEVSVA